MSLSLVAYEDSSDSETEEVPVGGKEGGRSDSKPDRQSKEDVRKLLAVLPPAKGVGGRGRSAKQPVRIGIPKLENEVSCSSIVREGCLQISHVCANTMGFN